MSKNTVGMNKQDASKSIIAAGLGADATGILVNNLNAKTVSGAQGTDPTEFATDEATLAGVVIDESGSLQPDQAQVEQEFADDLAAIKGSSQADEILMSIWAFSDRTRVMHSYLTLELVTGLLGYHPAGGTALYDGILDAFTSLVAYETELKKSGIRTKLNLAVFTDGHDNSSRSSADDVKKVALELLAKENCTLTLTGFVGAERPPLDPYDIAKAIGFPNVVKAGATPAERRRAFGTWSSSVIKTSQTKIGGSQSFFNP
jgi:hypothetical protein